MIESEVSEEVGDKNTEPSRKQKQTEICKHVNRRNWRNYNAGRDEKHQRLHEMGSSSFWTKKCRKYSVKSSNTVNARWPVRIKKIKQKIGKTENLIS